MKDLAIIQKTYDLIKWYIPILESFTQIMLWGDGDR